MDCLQHKCLVISDFNVDNFASKLRYDDEVPQVIPAVAPFGQVNQVLMQENIECWRRNHDFAVIWTQPHSVIESFNHIINYEEVSLDHLHAEVDKYSSMLIDMIDRVRFAFIPTWVLPSYYSTFGMLDMRRGVGIANILMRMNLRLSDNLEQVPNIYMLNAQRWVEIAGKNAFNPKLWYMGKIAFGNDVCTEAVRSIKAALGALSGNTKKLIILDLDDTLWGGVVGEIGLDGIRLGGHDHIGEAYVDFQRALKSLRNRGILLGIASKNEESVALETIQNHPEMVLRLEDFAGWKINWRDKAENIVSLASELNLGIESTVFIDDNPFERARVRETLPNVLVPELPADNMLYKKTLLSLRCFDTPSVTSEDLQRTKMYVSERQRANLRNKAGSFDDWLKTLGIVVKIQGLKADNLSRATQLLNKTNQMNLTTRRMTESELLAWVGQEGHELWLFRVSDKFGDSGLTGIISLVVEDKKARIVDYILSCRVFGRKVEETMLFTAIKYAESIKLHEVYAQYIPTPNNKPCLAFFNRSGFHHNQTANTFHWQTINEYPIPQSVHIEGGHL